MTPFPLDLVGSLGHWGQYVVYLAIGFGFGYVLEIAGFGKSTKLAGQFYLREMTVLKVMFGAIIVAMALVFLATGLGLLDYNLIWVNPTYLWPGIVGGLIMGVGFIVGGFCPGTSLVSAATFKVDGIVFAAGVFFGIFLFGESVGLFEDFWYSSYMGRFTLMDLFNADTGVIVLAVVVMALGAFALAEVSERVFGKGLIPKEPRWRMAAAGGMVVLAAGVLVIGQPTNADKWARMETEQQARIDNRDVYVHPGEALAYLHNRGVFTYIIDIRSEADYNAFHLPNANRVAPDALIEHAEVLLREPPNTFFLVVGNDEQAATDAWQVLMAESVPNLYILEGGINGWIDTFADADFQSQYALAARDPERLAYNFPLALGDRYAAADPNPDVFELEYTSKVVIAGARGATGGGCG